MKDPAEIAVDAWMKEFASFDDREHILPDPSVIWMKARVVQSARAAERAARPITTMQIAAYAAVAGCWAALLTWRWRAIQSWLDALRPSNLLIQGTAVSGASIISTPLIVTLLVLGSVTIALAMHTIFADD
jgi:hypothetical protein